MRICVPVPCFFGKMDFCEAIEKIAALGFDAAETYDWTHLDLDAVRRACERCGVELLSMCTTEFRMTDAAYRSAWLAGLEASCTAANRVGAKKLITQVGQDTGAPRDVQHESIAEALRQAVPILEKHGVTVMIEPLNTLYNHPGYYLWSAVEAFEIIREVNHPLVKVVYDIYHQQVMEGNIINNDHLLFNGSDRLHVVDCTRFAAQPPNRLFCVILFQDRCFSVSGRRADINGQL